MERKITRYDMFTTLGFLFMLICAVASFFYGVKIGTDKTEAKYFAAEQLQKKPPAATIQQQDLVSFYHNVFLPYHDFQNEWQKGMKKLYQDQSVNHTSLLKDLAGTADRQYKAAATVDFHNVPLLHKAQLSYLNSLDSFKKHASFLASSAKELPSAQLLQKINANEIYKKAANSALAAQQSYYTAMLKWSADVDPNIPSETRHSSSIALSAWKQLPLTAKNKIISDQLVNDQQLTEFYPHDLTCRVDEFILSGQASSMGLTRINEVIKLLVSTKAVRNGDFAASKSRLYSNEVMPLLPFF